MITRDAAHEPRLAIGRVGVPFFGRDFEKLAPGQSAVIDATRWRRLVPYIHLPGKLFFSAPIFRSLSFDRDLQPFG
jgi:hypothetical protein